MLGVTYGSITDMLGAALALLAIPLFVVPCNRLGKHNTLRLTLCSLAIGVDVEYFCYSPDLPKLLFIPPFFYSPAIASFYKVLLTMMGDVIDFDELRHGDRCEGFFGSVMSVILKSVSSFIAITSDIIIIASGFEIESCVHQDPSVFTNMIILFSIVFGLVSLLLINFKLTCLTYG